MEDAVLVVGLLVVPDRRVDGSTDRDRHHRDCWLPGRGAGGDADLGAEALNAVQAASQGEVQRSINTLYGSVVATVSLTVPAVLVLGVITNTDVILGLEPFEMVLLALTLILSYPHARLTGIEGLMKLVIFLFWILLQVA